MSSGTQNENEYDETDISNLLNQVAELQEENQQLKKNSSILQQVDVDREELSTMNFNLQKVIEDLKNNILVEKQRDKMNLMVQEELQNKHKEEEDKVDAKIKENEEASTKINQLEDDQKDLQKIYDNAQSQIKQFESTMTIND